VTLRGHLRKLASGLTARAVLEKFAAIQMVDAHFPTADGRELVFRRYTQPEKDQKILLLCFLALALWRALEGWLRSKGLGDCARQLLVELDQLRSLDVVLPTAETGEVRLRVVGRPEKALAVLLVQMGLELPQGPKILENVVQKIAS
jgi:hypothetical protein